MAAIQIIPVNVSIIEYFKIMIDDDNQGVGDAKVKEFKEQLSKALQGKYGNKEIEWRDDDFQKVEI